MTTKTKPPLTAAQRTALVLRDNRNSRFSTPLRGTRDAATTARIVGRSNTARTQ